MRTRCPECGTTFRVTSEQLRQKAGKVRCGHCQAIFNAFDHLLSDSEAAKPEAASSPIPEAAPAETPPAMSPAAPLAALEELPEAVSEELPEAPVGPESLAAAAEIPPPAVDGAAEPVFVADETLVVHREHFFAAPPLPADEAPSEAGAAEELPEETPEESTQAAREAGLVAARELADTPAYNRWAAGALAGNSFGGFDAGSARRPLWPFALAAVLLSLLLLGQLAYFYRGELVLRVPALASLYQGLGVAVPLPRNADLIAIEASDLQSDNARGLFVLQATLKNRAAYAQAWPVLELTLTDINDAVVSRRAMYAADYLPPGTPAESFAANGELAVRLWVEAKGIGATGYRLYLFYP